MLSTDLAGAAASPCVDDRFPSFLHWNQNIDFEFLATIQKLNGCEQFRCQFCLASIYHSDIVSSHRKILPGKVTRFPLLAAYQKHIRAIVNIKSTVEQQQNPQGDHFSFVCGPCYQREFSQQLELTKPHSFAPWALPDGFETTIVRQAVNKMLHIAYSQYNTFVLPANANSQKLADTMPEAQLFTVLQHYFNGAAMAFGGFPDGLEQIEAIMIGVGLIIVVLLVEILLHFCQGWRTRYSSLATEPSA